MNSAVVMLLALIGAPAEAPSWSTDYWQARTQGKTQNKPLAVVIGTGANGQAKVCHSGQLSNQLQSAIADHYVAVYVDSSLADGKMLAQQFGIKTGIGIVISDRSGNYQSFNHDGSLPEAELIQQLERSRTNQVRTSFYPSTTINGGSSSAPSIRLRSC